MSSFDNVKKLNFVITLGAGTFPNGTNQVTLTGLRAIVEVDKGGGQMMCSARIRIFGMTQQLMNKLTTLSWRTMTLTKNTVQVNAIDGDITTMVYTGQVINAWADYQAAPDACMYFQTQTGIYDQVNPVPPKSYTGTTDVAGIFKTLAGELSVSFENNGVQQSLSNPYLPGSVIDQVRQVAQASNTNFYFDNGVLAITPNGVARQIGQVPVPLISKATGLDGYPTFDNFGIYFQALFNPAILFGGQILMQSSDVVAANGTWQVASINHRLESEKPGGQWFSQIVCRGDGLVPIN